MFTLPETLPSRVLTNKAKRIRKLKVPGYENVQSPVEASNQTLGTIFRVALTRPVSRSAGCTKLLRPQRWLSEFWNVIMQRRCPLNVQKAIRALSLQCHTQVFISPFGAKANIYSPVHHPVRSHLIADCHLSVNRIRAHLYAFHYIPDRVPTATRMESWCGSSASDRSTGRRYDCRDTRLLRIHLGPETNACWY